MPTIEKHADSDGSFHCPETSCTKTYRTWGEMNKCARRHFKEYECGQCPLRSGSRRDIERHVRTHAPTSETFFCGTCQAPFMRKDNMQRHEAIFHTLASSEDG
ncbi:hypothetical protein Micbo1qcDRAFT_11416 [Microdochium bolleyi]|uniref:C2H2-type domain-containing protein n=1 Tax=Microdochium bolleyi TaxID=196109 RepID=A0A136IY78_9PEZI|nr:hypothetical protein Micbo1qcDRAFT_11416 [Microdochium bolleyi]